MIADFKCSGGRQDGIDLATYMLNPEAKEKQVGIKQHCADEESSERILLVATDHTLPILNDTPPKQAAAQFLDSVEKWNKQHRVGQKLPKNSWEQIVVAFSPEDSNKITPAKAVAIAREALREVAPGKRPTLYAVHGDTRHIHVHLMYATVNDQHRIHNKHADYRLWENAMERLEIKYKLHRVHKRKACSGNDPSRLPDGTNPTKQEYRMTQRTGEQSCKQRLRGLIDDAIESSKAAPEAERFTKFLTALRSKNIGISANIQSSGNVLGLRFYYGIFSQHGIKSSALGKQYAWGKLSENTGFKNNSAFHTTLLKLVDHRVTSWSKHESGGKKWAGSAVKSAMGNKPANSMPATTSNKLPLPSSQGASPIASPEFPVEYPEWLKQYIRAIVNAANAELRRQQQTSDQKNQSIECALQLLISIQQRTVNKHVGQYFPERALQKKKSNNPMKYSG